MVNRFAGKIAARKFFYRDYYRKSVAALLLCLLMIAGLIVGIIYEAILLPQNSDYYATSTVGDLFTLQAAELANPT